MNVLSLFAGIGGLDLGLERAGMHVVGQVEIDPYCQRVLARHWPEVPRHDDVRTAVEWWHSQPRPSVDLICGGPPCQPVSQAGRRRYTADERWMWPAMADTIRALRPRYTLIENVPGLLIRGLDAILADLAESGFDADWDVVSAAAVGAPHLRERVFIVADADSARGPSAINGQPAGSASPLGLRPTLFGRRSQPRRQPWWRTEPDVGRVAHGIPARVDRLRSLGNAVVPQVAEHVAQLIIAHDRALTVIP